jgi:hypothetical protein
VAQLVRNAFSVPDIFVLLTRTEKGALRSMLSDIVAKPIDIKDLDLTDWDEHLHHQSEIKTLEIEVDKPTDLNSLLTDIRKSHEKFLPIAVSQNKQMMPFTAVNSLDIGDKLIILQP